MSFRQYGARPPDWGPVLAGPVGRDRRSHHGPRMRGAQRFARGDGGGKNGGEGKRQRRQGRMQGRVAAGLRSSAAARRRAPGLGTMRVAGLAPRSAKGPAHVDSNVATPNRVPFATDQQHSLRCATPGVGRAAAHPHTPSRGIAPLRLDETRVRLTFGRPGGLLRGCTCRVRGTPRRCAPMSGGRPICPRARGSCTPHARPPFRLVRSSSGSSCSPTNNIELSFDMGSEEVFLGSTALRQWSKRHFRSTSWLCVGPSTTSRRGSSVSPTRRPERLSRTCLSC